MADGAVPVLFLASGQTVPGGTVYNSGVPYHPSGAMYVSGDFTTALFGAAPAPAVDASTGAHTITSPEFASRHYIASAISADASHTTPTAAAIIAAFTPAAQVGATFLWTAVNPTAFTLTILGGTGVTFVGSAVVDSTARAHYLATIVSASAVTLTRLYSEAVGA